MNNLINIYMIYLKNTLIKISLLYYKEDQEFINKILDKYISCYIDNYYYNIYHTVDKQNSYTDELFKLELNGLEIEILDDYYNLEFEEENNIYNKRVNLIKQLKNFTYKLISIDQINKKEELDEISNNLNIDLKELTKIYNNYLNKKNKYLTNYDNYYSLEYKNISNNYQLLSINHNIKLLDNYKKNLVNRVYKKEEFNLMKIKNIINKFSLYILNKKLNNQPIKNRYLIKIDKSIINRANLENDIYNLLNNPLINKYLILLIPYDLYISYKIFNNYKVIINLDLSHINDIGTKLDTVTSIDKEILISNYKDKDFEYLNKYTYNEKKLIIYKEE